MFTVYLISFLILAYLLGSVNYAILVARGKGIDIRALDTRNPGTANIGRNVGKGWAAIVFFLDISKAVVPMLLARQLVFTDQTPAQYLALFAVGIAAILGHCKPLFFNFKGGGGIATSIGVYFFFIPVEFFVSVLLGFTIAMLFFRNRKYPVGQLTPIAFVTITPFLTLIVNQFRSVEITRYLKIGGHPWYVIVGLFAVSVFILLMNVPLLFRRFTHQEPIVTKAD